MLSGRVERPSRLAALCTAATLIAAAQAGATTPDRSWRGVERVSILCQVTADHIVGNDVVAKTLCERVSAIARNGSPVPVEIVGYGDPSLESGDTVALLVQASVTDVAPSRPALIFTTRTTRSGGLEPSSYFGAAPRVAPFTSAADGAAWDRAIAASLSEVLPWLRPAEPSDLLPTDTRIINNNKRSGESQ